MGTKPTLLQSFAIMTEAPLCVKFRGATGILHASRASGLPCDAGARAPASARGEDRFAIRLASYLPPWLATPGRSLIAE